MKKHIAVCVSLCLIFSIALAQPADQDWYFNSPGTYSGIGVDELYSHLGDRAPKQKVIVAILDSGVDINHEDLKENIWVNTDEIPGNGIDDDHNGYVDDVHGWNFLGNANGTNVTKETLEVTRLYAFYKEYFSHKDLQNLSKKDQALYDTFLEYERVVQSQRNSAKSVINDMEDNSHFINLVLDTFDAYYPHQQLNDKFLDSFDPGDHELLRIAKEVFNQSKEFGLELTDTDALRTEIEDSYKEVMQESRDDLDYRYNPDFNSREIIGDNYADQTECCYGNNDVRGGFAFHGTHVSGIVGALWNDVGTRGVAKYVELMPVRTVPNGDEHDKDVANAIRYAVDNGARVINMSFGKGQAWDKKVVDDAVKYARKHDVLLVHGAGNDAESNDESANFPNAFYDKHCIFGKKEADNWIEVGASNYKPGADVVAPFSNYGKHSVDLFAPGMYIYSSAPDDHYEMAQGTSMASPVVAGVAAVIRAYFPDLKAHEVRDILMQSATPIKGTVVRPGDQERVEASELSRTGGIVNVYEAFKMAEARSSSSGKKKGSSDTSHDGRA